MLNTYLLNKGMDFCLQIEKLFSNSASYSLMSTRKKNHLFEIECGTMLTITFTWPSDVLGIQGVFLSS